MNNDEIIRYWNCEMIKEFEFNINVDILVDNDFLIILKHEIKDFIRYIEYVLILSISFINGALVTEILKKQFSVEYSLFLGFTAMLATMLFLIFIFFKLINNYVIKLKYKRLLKNFSINKLNPSDVIIYLSDLMYLDEKNGIVLLKTEHETYKLKNVNASLFNILTEKIGIK